jgi:TPR repeat protein
LNRIPEEKMILPFPRSSLLAHTLLILASFVSASWPNENDELLKKAKSGDLLSQFELGVRYRHEHNSSSAVYWLEVAAKQGLPEAQFELSLIRYQGDPFDKRIENYLEAIYWLKQYLQNKNLSSKEIARAEHVLGNIYYQECDLVEHTKLISLTACGGESPRRINRDYVAAIGYFRSASEKGSKYACYQLAQMHQAGRGTPQDFVEAERWYRAAIWDEGSEWSEPLFALGKLKLQMRDSVAAHAWFNLAAAANHELAAEARDNLARTMSPQDIVEAQAFARNFRMVRKETSQESSILERWLGWLFGK